MTYIFPGVTRIGREDAAVPQDITIQGVGIEAEHCIIINTSGVIILDPCGNLCSLDGVPVTSPVPLTQGEIYRGMHTQDRKQTHFVATYW